MENILHKKARTTPEVRSEIMKSDLSAYELAKKYGVTPATIYKWKKRKDVSDLPHTRHNLLTSTSEVEEELIVQLRTKLELSVDDITYVMQKCVNKSLSRSAIYRCMKRKNVSKLKPAATKKTYGVFDEEKCGFIHMDVKYLTKLSGKRSYVYVAIDRATRYVYAEILYDLKPQTTADFVGRFIKDFPHEIRVILTDNGFEWTDKCAGKIKNAATGNHPVDQICNELSIEHRLIKPRKPQTNGMVERFNRRINEAIAKKNKISANQGKNSFESHKKRNEFILQFVYNYNRTRLKCLDYQTPLNLICNHTEDNTFTFSVNCNSFKFCEGSFLVFFK